MYFLAFKVSVVVQVVQVAVAEVPAAVAPVAAVQYNKKLESSVPPSL